jgi:hypothetical protein
VLGRWVREAPFTRFPSDVGLVAGRLVRVGLDVVRVEVGELVELLDGDSVGDSVGDAVEEVGLDEGLSVRVRVVVVEDSLVVVDLLVNVEVDRGTLLRPPKAGDGKSSTSVPSSAPSMKAVHTRTGMLPPVTSLSPPRPFRDSCTA